MLIEVNCETDFVARNEQFQELVRALAVQVAGLYPRWVDVDEIPAEVLGREEGRARRGSAVAGEARRDPGDDRRRPA